MRQSKTVTIGFPLIATTGQTTSGNKWIHEVTNLDNHRLTLLHSVVIWLPVVAKLTANICCIEAKVPFRRVSTMKLSGLPETIADSL